MVLLRATISSRRREIHRMRRIRDRVVVAVVVVVATMLLLQKNEVASIYVIATAANGICDLECPTTIGSKCNFGESPHLLDSTPSSSSSSGSISSINGMHCVCPEFFTGIQCEFTYDTCNDANQHVCYHGGTCQSGAVDAYGNRQHYCDCSNATSVQNTHPYVGKYCELATVSTCNDPIEPNLYCFNGGICNDRFPEFGQPCLCSGGHSGPRCEYTFGDNVTTVDEDGIILPPNSSSREQCTLSCANGGTCVYGKRSSTDQADEYLYWNTEDNTNDDMYCQCTDAWDGPTCTIEKIVCGDKHCFHGATCQVRSDNVDSNNPTVTHHCDCTTADNSDASYAGRFCQYQATEYCTKNPGLNGELFCVNHGVCRVNAFEGCDCPYGYEGFSCEFKTSTTTEDNVEVVNESDGRPVLDPVESADCTMECINGGTCRHGPKRLGGGLDIFAGNTSYMNEEAGTSNDFQHCVCPNNFSGTICEHALDSCGETQHLCVHGGKCVDLGSEQLCDCDTAESPLATFFAGNHCEHPVNDICTETTTATPNVEVSPSSVILGNTIPGSPVAFCVNGGTCKAVILPNEPHPGCHCPEGYLGPHCELRESSEVPNIRENDPYANQRVPQYDDSNGPGGFTIFVLIFSIVSVCVVSSYILVACQRRRRRHNAAVSSTIRWSEPNFRDGGSTEVNIAPKRGSSLYSDDGNNISPYEDAMVALPTDVGESWTSSVTIRSATRDLMVNEPMVQNSFTAGVGDVDEYADENDNHLDDDDDNDEQYALPQIDIGPPIDEDGHELHNVEIV